MNTSSYKIALGLLVLCSVSCMSAVVTPESVALPAQTVSVEGPPLGTPTGAPAESEMFTVCGELNIRGVPSPVGPVLGWLSFGEEVRVYEVIGNWSRIGDDLWVNSLYLCN